ncbi:MAG TPA: sialidase family protein [Planctomycetaceae bacterium]|nr:sialidase family protein [Planctomycetaceae bacterium]
MLLVLGFGSATVADASGPPGRPAGVVLAEFVYEAAPFPQCHASTIAETPLGLVAAWFGGTREKHEDVGIWIARRGESGWSAPERVADGVVDGRDYPCWNPVLFQPAGGPLLLFYKVGPSPSTWWGVLATSEDGGATWGEHRRLPDGILGPVKNRPLQLADGSILCGSSSEHDGWRVHLEWTPDRGRTWHTTGPLNHGDEFGAIQPGLLQLDRTGRRLQILCRSREGRIVESRSDDAGRSWTPLAATRLPNPNSGLDAVTLADGRSLVVYNHTPRGRSPLNVAVTENGRDWQAAVVLEDQPGEYSYPAVIQAGDGRIHLTYTWKRQRVRHVVLDPETLRLRPIRDGRWPE